MLEAQKKEIQLHLMQFIPKFKSQRAAADSLKSVSEATIIQMRSGNWDSISDEMWQNVGNQIGWQKKKVTLIETLAVQTLFLYFGIAKEEGTMFSMVADPGGSKTFTSHAFEEMNRDNVYHIECNDYWNKKLFLTAIMEKLGKPDTGYNVAEMMECITTTLRRKYQPLLIIDEVDKLNDQVLYFLITFYNRLNGICGITLLSTDYFEKRVDRGRKLNKKGFKELFSRMGKKFIRLPQTNKKELAEICQSQGVTSQDDITEIYHDYEGDLRRVSRQILKKAVNLRFTQPLKTA